MLDRFKVPKEDQIVITEESLRRTVTAIFEKMGLVPEDAANGADVLVTADLRGVETHGVSNKMADYVGLYTDGSLNPRPDWRIERESPGTAVIDGDHGLGIIIGSKAMDIAIEKARKVGVGIVTVHNSGHLGAVGHFAMQAAEADMVGMCGTATGASILPTFGAETRMGTNPISIAAPAREEPPLLFDAATSAIAGNKFRLAARVGADLLPGWISSKDGTPIMEPTQPPSAGEYHMLPLGGIREQGSHKGFGFALMVETLATMLSGVLPSMVNPSALARHYFAAYDIAQFTEVATFKANMDQMLRTLRDTKPAPGHDRVLYPGLAESEEELVRHANGIPLHREVVDWFDDLCSELTAPSLVRA
ncbi:MAG: Ldh family oxidoreductase [SAR202 cluster bacterium]|jgi:LDH2 family malate/lactate/ureidoglycolate dehydrogenase|nr:Ldh family oxidoreductase [SAR202 cluster bacterium]MDP6665664.1 Ldh family oxidoreductase [SAR202 cluster bacterium]MDP6799942.1 Ldh family oxidoreductase [SAR202 cluster bacterium]MQG57131.1 Ldh family oxidoreductase [SAR202 cluster bacterium]MQG68977.1 Ldh family oxidoreductase [SAR202 cluster bacterium]|tara:strand:+ start:2371 stop:3459 length:1089 start_codon:yes stop_codon:yes gene_type:complete